MRLHCNWPPSETMEMPDKQLSSGKPVSLPVVASQVLAMKKLHPATTAMVFYHKQHLQSSINKLYSSNTDNVQCSTQLQVYAHP